MVTFEHGKKKREELRLPIQHFVVIDDWLEKLGTNAYLGWLRFYTWVDRSSPQRDVDLIPYSMKAVAKKLGCSEATLYKTVIRPLWNYGLIDIREITIKNIKHKNIIVYEYPQNEVSLATKPLEQIRNYETDYTSASRVGGQKGGKQSGFKKLKPVALKNLSYRLQKIKAINVVNNSFNVLNNSTNESNKDLISQSVHLPDSLVAAIQRNGLTDRLTEIATAHEIFVEQPGYSLPLLVLTLGKKALKEKRNSPPDVFYQYLVSALHNNLNQISQPNRAATPLSEPSVPKDKLPASVKAQEERERLDKGNEQSKRNQAKTVKDIPELKELLDQLKEKRNEKPYSDEAINPIEHCLKQEVDPDDRPY